MQLNRLQSKMEIAHVRPEDLATKTGLSISTIMKARRGRKRPKPPTPCKPSLHSRRLTLT